MSILLAITGWSPDEWLQQFRMAAPDRDIRLFPEIGDAADIRYGCAWKPQKGAFSALPNLRAVFSFGAGVDHVFTDPDLPDVPIIRIVDPDLTMRMTEFIVLQVLTHHRNQRQYDRLQQDRVWRELDQPAASAVRVGVMGLGVLGRDAACVLSRLGFKVSGWSRTPKTASGMETYHGSEGLMPFLEQTDILVVVLPLTTSTEGVINYELLSRLRQDGALGGPILINVGRGGLQVEQDILRALNDGTLRAATLDVFEEEPLPENSPFWDHPNVVVTPHVAATSAPIAITRAIIEQIKIMDAGLRPAHVVDRDLGY